MSIEKLNAALLECKEILSEEDYQKIEEILEDYNEEQPQISFEEELKNLEEAEGLKQQGGTLFKRGEYEEAAEKYTEALTKDPKNKLLYSNRSACHAKMGNIERAIKDAKKSIRIDPAFAKGYSRLGNLYSETDPQKALGFFEKAVENDSSNSEYKKSAAAMKKKLNRSPVSSPYTGNNSGNMHKQMEMMMKDPEMKKMAENFLKDKSPEEIEKMNKMFSDMMK